MRILPLVAAFVLGGLVQQGASHLGDRVVVGARVAPVTAAQLEIHGTDAGLSHVIAGQPGSTVDEAFSLHAGPDSTGAVRKMHSLSTRWVDPIKRIAVTRYNSTYAGPDGIQRDDLAIQVYGGNGVALFAPDSHPRLMPGKGVLWVNGRIEFGPEGGKVDLAAKIAALEARLEQLERNHR